MLSSGEVERARKIALRRWRSVPTSPLADVFSEVRRALGVSTTSRLEQLPRRDQGRAFDVLRVVAEARLSLLRGGALDALRELDGAVHGSE